MLVEIRDEIRFLLNDRPICLKDIASTDTLLDYLRLDQRLRGTKEGCAEGDCGACTVLVGRMLDGQLVYETVNACIRFVGSLDACHIVTIEHLKSPKGDLHPVQQAMVDQHGSQCGFCTPGIVMSLYALWMSNPSPSVNEIETALQGNLCRCTGYEPIIKAAIAASSNDTQDSDPLIKERQNIFEQLKKLGDGKRVEINKGENDKIIVPASLDDLADVRSQYPNSTIVAGSTDVGLWVTKNMRSVSPVIFIVHLAELHQVKVLDNTIHIGAGVTYSQLQPYIEEHIPQIAELWNRIGGAQVRNMGTIGGNIANGSPIGDTPPALIALGAKVVLRQAEIRRTIDMEKFFIEYGKQDRIEGDFVETIEIPLPQDDDLFAVYKISKRRDEDISALCGAFKIRVDSDIITEVKVAFGGMAGTPKRATNTEAKLLGKNCSLDTIENAVSAMEQDFQPLSDWRASAEYRNLAAQNLLRRFYHEMSGTGEVRLNSQNSEVALT